MSPKNGKKCKNEWWIIQTDSNAFSAGGRQDEGDDRQDWKDAAR